MPTEMIIREASEADIPAMHRLIERAVRVTNAPDYTPEQIDMIAANFTEAKLRQKMAVRDVFVAELETRIAGTISLERNKLHSLFVDTEFQGEGIGTKLVEFLEDHARRKGLDTLILSASLTARPFYDKQGYHFIEIEEHRAGRTHAMEKRIAE